MKFSTRALLLSASLISFQIHADDLPKVLPQVEEFLPTNSEEVNDYLYSAEENVQEAVDAILSLPEEEKVFSNIIKCWNELTIDLLSDFSTLLHVAQSDSPAAFDATIALAELQSYVHVVVLQNQDLYQTLIGSVEKALQNAETLSSYDCHVMNCLLSSCKQFNDTLTAEEQQRLLQVTDLCYKQKKTPFLYLKGTAEEKNHSEDPLSILSLNVCLLPGSLPLLWGGVGTWEDRISPLAAKILESNADVVCLQEVFVEEAGIALYEKLSEHYSHFYTLISPRPLGFTFETLGCPSGLFVASKYPIVNPEFTLYSVAGFPANWGVFDFTVVGSNQNLGRIYTTHLQSFDYMQFPKIRSIQLQEVLNKMEIDFQLYGNEIPYFLCGDLNIPLGSKEPGELMIQQYFHDAFNQEPREISEEYRTCTGYLTGYVQSKDKNPETIPTQFQILDYALLLRTLPSLQGMSVSDLFQMETTLVPMNDLKKPDEAISDHHGLLSKIVRKN